MHHHGLLVTTFALALAAPAAGQTVSLRAAPDSGVDASGARPTALRHSAAVAWPGPTRDGRRVGISDVPATPQSSAKPGPLPVAAPTRENGRVMAIVGGAVFLGGLLIDDDAGTALALGGLILGAWGLYIWMR